jgi:imidazoleglycerol-phosphate dehydratase
MRRGQVENGNDLTEIRVDLDLDGFGRSAVGTGIPFFDHMLATFAKHGLLDLEVAATGGSADRVGDSFHIVEGVAVAAGEAFAKAFSDKKGVARYAATGATLSDAAVRVILDVAGQGEFYLHGTLPKEDGAPFDGRLAEIFFRRLSIAAGWTLHVEVVSGSITHYVIETAFKAVAIALRAAATRDPRVQGAPSTRGVL